MKFVDEAVIRVEAGKGGKGAVSFRREKYIPRGGPDGGNGGRGGNVILVGHGGLNTLVDFRHQRDFRAEHGQPGGTRQKAGRGGADLLIRVPVGTVVTSADGETALGEVLRDGQELVLARGGAGGRGNETFKSSTNRTPRQSTPGEPGERLTVKLELKVLADVGLLGFPNAGKSTLIRALSAATPKVADYPFTTLYPSLGVVSPAPAQSFVIADIPGLIEGAAEGAGLGLRFLRHVQRARLLWHLVDLAPALEDEDPTAQVRAIEGELGRFDPALLEKPRWLVFTKADLLAPDEREERAAAIVAALGWDGPAYTISSLAGEGLEVLALETLAALESMWSEDPAPDPGEAPGSPADPKAGGSDAPERADDGAIDDPTVDEAPPSS